MTQELSDLRQRSASTQQIGGEGVAQQVGPFERWVQTGALEGAANDTVDGGGADQAAQRRTHADEDPSYRTAGTSVTQIVDQRRADVRRQRQSHEPLALAADENLAPLPIQIVQGHGDDLSSAQSEARQKQQDRIVAFTDWHAAITRHEHPFDLFRRNRLGQMRKAPVGYPRHGAGEIHRNRAPLSQKAQKRTQRGDHQLSAATASRLSVTYNKTLNVDRAQFVELHRLAVKPLDEKTSNDR